jgi:hypothetical protein
MKPLPPVRTTAVLTPVEILSKSPLKTLHKTAKITEAIRKSEQMRMVRRNTVAEDRNPVFLGTIS